MRTPWRPGDRWIEENIVKPHYAAAEEFTRALGYGCHAALADRLGLSAWDAGYLIVALQMRGVLMQELDAEGHWKMWQTPEFLKPDITSRCHWSGIRQSNIGANAGPIGNHLRALLADYCMWGRHESTT
jgi:hypothetical protein